MACAAGAQAIAIQNESAFLNSFSGALIGAGAAGNADISVDDILAVALRDSLTGAPPSRILWPELPLWVTEASSQG